MTRAETSSSTSASLVDKSLIRQHPVAGVEPRYGTLETIREYALRASGCSERRASGVRDAHATWCIQLAEARRQHGDMWNEPPTSDQLVPPVDG